MIDLENIRTLAGRTLYGSDGEKIGKIVDVYESTDGSGGTFATVKTGLFGGASSFFPLLQAELDGDDVRLPWSRSHVHDAPRVENDDDLTAEEEARLFAYYELPAGTPQDTGAGGLRLRRVVVSESQADVVYPETDPLRGTSTSDLNR